LAEFRQALPVMAAPALRRATTPVPGRRQRRPERAALRPELEPAWAFACRGGPDAAHEPCL